MPHSCPPAGPPISVAKPCSGRGGLDLGTAEREGKGGLQRTRHHWRIWNYPSEEGAWSRRVIEVWPRGVCPPGFPGTAPSSRRSLPRSKRGAFAGEGRGPHRGGLVSHCSSELPLPQLHASSAHSPLHRDPCTAAVPGALSPSPCTWMERRKAWPSVRRKQVHHGRRGTWETVTEGRESVWQAQAATLLMDAPIHACIHSFIHTFIHSSMHPFMHSTRPSWVSVPGCYHETKPAGLAHTDHRPGGGDAGPPGGCRSRAEGLLTLISDVRRDSWKVRHL